MIDSRILFLGGIIWRTKDHNEGVRGSFKRHKDVVSSRNSLAFVSDRYSKMVWRWDIQRSSLISGLISRYRESGDLLIISWSMELIPFSKFEVKFSTKTLNSWWILSFKF